MNLLTIEKSPNGLVVVGQVIGLRASGITGDKDLTDLGRLFSISLTLGRVALIRLTARHRERKIRQGCAHLEYMQLAGSGRIYSAYMKTISGVETKSRPFLIFYCSLSA